MNTRGKHGTKKHLALQDQHLCEAILGRIAAREGMTREMMAHRLGMSESTLTRRLQKPREFTLGELRKLSTELGWGQYDIYRNLFGE